MYRVCDAKGGTSPYVASPKKGGDLVAHEVPIKCGVSIGDDIRLLQSQYGFPPGKGEVVEQKEVLSLLIDDATIAGWNNEGLPSDAMSTENATILTQSIKWPLMIDPQLQGIKWIKNRYGKDLHIIRLGQKNFMDIVER